MNAIRAALSYFTILPVGSASRPDSEAIAWLPFVGAVTGAAAGTLALTAARISPAPIVVAVAFGATLILTGAIHFDGFLDGCDAFFVSAPQQRRREILKGPHHGSFAVAGAATLTVFWVAALSGLSPSQLPLALALTAASARWGSIARSAVSDLPARLVLLAGLVLIATLAALLGVRGAITALVTIVFAFACVTWAESRLGGERSGDAYGFAISIAEVAGLVCLAVTDGWR